MACPVLRIDGRRHKMRSLVSTRSTCLQLIINHPPQASHNTNPNMNAWKVFE